MFAEFRAGQFGYNFGLDSNTGATRYESVTTNQVLGGGRDWELRRRRNQYTGALSYFKDNFSGGSHNLKFGGEYLDEEGNDAVEPGLRRQRDPLRSRRPHRPALGDHARLGAPLQQRGRRSAPWPPTSFFVTDTWTVNRLTDEHRRSRSTATASWLPEQSFTGRPVRAGGDRASRAARAS